MANDQTQEQKDFFISYTGKDSQWAQWIAFELEEAGYTTLIQAWDFRPGSNFVAKMDEAAMRTERTILVLSEAYLTSNFAFSEWAAAFRNDPRGTQGKVLPVRIQRCRIEGLLGPIGYIDLVDLDEQKAREKLLAGVKRERAKPASVPFPTASAPSGPLMDRPVFPGLLPPIWNVPYPQNPLFTGREELLTQLATSLHAGQPTALSQPQAITGLGGIGKTQLALEYAYRHRQDYLAVLWAQADTRENLTSSYLTIATLLNLPEKSEQESTQVIAAVKAWLQRTTGWLLILDNADDLALARDFLPPSIGGQVLLTTRAQATGRFARCLEVDVLPTVLGTLFLLRRAGLLAPDALLEQASENDRDQARSICEELGGLPLALDQAGAYIEEIGCSLAEYQRLYQHRRADLLAERRGQLVDDHPLPVATTWSLSFTQVEQNNPAAADLLRLCAFLAPEAIPLAIITEGGSYLGPKLALLGADPYLLDQAIEVLRAYSLLRREASNEVDSLLSIHRLVQAVLKDVMTNQTQQEWIQRAIRSINAIYPESNYVTWTRHEQLLSHIQACAFLTKQQNGAIPEAASLFSSAGYYLTNRARYKEAEILLRLSVQISKQLPESESYRIARSVKNLASFYRRLGKYEEALTFYRQAAKICEQLFGSEHLNTIQCLQSIAVVLDTQEKYGEAEPLYQRVLQIREQQLGPDHPHTADTLHNLAALYSNQGKYEQAEPLLKRALQIYEQQLGPEHPDTASTLYNLALLYSDQGKYSQAEPLLKRALSIDEKALGSEHPDLATDLNNLARFYSAQGKYSQAEPLLKRALEICKQRLGPQHPNTQTIRTNYTSLLRAMGREKEMKEQETS